MKIETILEEVNKFTSANTVDKKYISAESKQRKWLIHSKTNNVLIST